MNLYKNYLKNLYSHRLISLLKRTFYPALLFSLIILNFVVLVNHPLIAEPDQSQQVNEHKAQASLEELLHYPVDTYQIKDNYWSAKRVFKSVESLERWLNLSACFF